MQQLAIVAAVATTSLASTGHMTTLGGTGVGGSCEYADAADGGRKSPAATSPHLVSHRYCGVNAKLLKGGAGCGECYNVCKGARCEVVQVVDTADVDFACTKTVMRSITGATTGIFPVTYQKIACEVASAKGVATVLDGNNAYFTKAIFSDLPHAVSSAKLMIGSKRSFSMDRVAGATFKANTDGPSKYSVSFELTLSDGSVRKLDRCFKSWPVATDSFCAPAATAFDAVATAAEPCPFTSKCMNSEGVCTTCAKSPWYETDHRCTCGPAASDWMTEDQCTKCPTDLLATASDAAATAAEPCPFISKCMNSEGVCATCAKSPWYETDHRCTCGPAASDWMTEDQCTKCPTEMDVLV